MGIISWGIIRLFKAKPFDSEALDKLAESMKAYAILKRDKHSRYYKANPFFGGCMSYSELIIFDEKYYEMLTSEEVLSVGAHELNHIARRHVLRRLPRTVLPAVVISAIIGSLISLTPVSTFPLIGQMSHGLFIALVVTFSLLFSLLLSFYANAKWLRQQETECDLSAVEFAEGDAMISALMKFQQRFPRKSLDKKISRWFPRTYPSLDQRISDIKLASSTKNN